MKLGRSVSIGFTDITGVRASTEKLVNYRTSDHIGTYL